MTVLVSQQGNIPIQGTLFLKFISQLLFQFHCFTATM